MSISTTVLSKKTSQKLSDQKVTMGIKSFIILALMSLLQVNAQAPALAPTTATPSPFLAKIHQFHNDVHTAKTTGNVNTSQLIADIQAIVAAAPSQANIPPVIATQITNLQNIVKQLGSTANPQQLLHLIVAETQAIIAEIRLTQPAAVPAATG